MPFPFLLLIFASRIVAGMHVGTLHKLHHAAPVNLESIKCAQKQAVGTWGTSHWGRSGLMWTEKQKEILVCLSV